MKKKFLLLVLILTFTAIFAGCKDASVYTSLTYDSDGKSSSGAYVHRFGEKEGGDIHVLRVEKDSKFIFKLDSMVKRGEIHFAIETEQEKIIYEASGKTISFNESFHLKEGLYKIFFDYYDAKRGSLKLEVYSDSPFDYCSGSGSDASLKR